MIARILAVRLPIQFCAVARHENVTQRIQQAKGEFTDLKVGILHLADLIDSVVRQADDEDGGGLIPAKSRVQQLYLKSSSIAANQESAVGGGAALATVDGNASGAGGEPAAAAPTITNTTSSPALEGEGYCLRSVDHRLGDRCILALAVLGLQLDLRHNPITSII